MKTLKTWEIRELMDRYPSEMLGKEFKLVNGILDKRNDGHISAGETAMVSRFPGFLGLTRNSFRVKDLTGFEEWEEVKKPVTFMEVVESGKEFTVQHPYIQDEGYQEDYKFRLYEFMHVFEIFWSDDEVKDVLTTAKFYTIEE